MTVPIDIAKIHWSGVGIAAFQVRGQQPVNELLARDPTATVNMEQRAQLLHDPVQGRVVLVLHVQMQALVGKPAKPIDLGGKFELQFFYDVENLAELMLTDEAYAEPVVHPQLGIMLAAIAYSTARGILWTRLAGTPLEGISLPIIKPHTLFQAPPAKRAKKATSPPPSKPR